MFYRMNMMVFGLVLATSQMAMAQAPDIEVLRAWAAQGDEDGPYGRELIATFLMPKEIAQAQEMAAQ